MIDRVLKVGGEVKSGFGSKRYNSIDSRKKQESRMPSVGGEDGVGSRGNVSTIEKKGEGAKDAQPAR